MSISMRGSFKTLAACLLAVAATAGCLVVLGGHPATSHADAVVDVNAVVSQLAKDYPVLGQPGSGKDLATDRPITSAKFAESVPQLIPARGRVLARDDARTLLLVPRTDGQVCIEALFADGTAGGNCNSTGQSPVLVTYGKAVGVVPASVKQLTYTLADGKSVAATPDADGLYTAPAEARTVSYVDGNDPQTIDLMPASAKAADVSVPAL
ncbi:MAG: hypothetical protein JWM93_2305 [Frankiales bacterium]|nr:hypothetical protein [Frankiales bacterium]